MVDSLVVYLVDWKVAARAVRKVVMMEWNWVVWLEYHLVEKMVAR